MNELMENNKINFVSNVVMPILTGLVTIALFFLFQPEEAGALFYTNLVYTLLLESIFFGYLFFSRSGNKSISGAFYSIIAVWGAFFIVCAGGWILLYSLLLSTFISYKVYIAVHIVLLLLWLIIGSLVTQTDSNYQEKVEVQKQQTKSIQFYTEKLKVLAARYSRELKAKGNTSSKQDGEIALETLIIKISHLSPAIFRNDMAGNQLNSLMERCEDIVLEMEEDTDMEISATDLKMKRFANNATDEVNLLRNLTRG